MTDSYLNGPTSERQATKLTRDQALTIKRRRELGQHYAEQARALSLPALAKKFGRSRQSISRIIARTRWDKPHPNRKSYADLNYDEAELIRECAAVRDGYRALAAANSVKALAAEYGVSEDHITAITAGRRWVYLGVKYD